MLSEDQVRRVEPDITVVSLAGRLNLGNTLQSLETGLHRLIQEGSRKMVLDLTNLAYIDSAAIGMLIGTNGVMEQAGGKLRLAGSHAGVAHSFGVVHMDRVVPLDATVADACQALAS